MTQTKHTTDKKYWDKVRDFNLSRTNIWILLAWQLLETVIPFLAIWLLVGPDFEGLDFNYWQSLSTPSLATFLGASFGLVIWAFGLNLVTFFLRLQKADSFTFTTGFIFVFLMILLNGLWQHNWAVRTDLKIFLRFFICLVALVPGMFLGLVITSLFRNWRYKNEEDDETMLIAYHNGTEVPTREKLRLARAAKLKAKRDQEAVELLAFREALDAKLVDAYEANQVKFQEREAKLDAKEAKQRQKRRLKKIKK